VSSYMEKKAIRALSVSQRVKCLLIRTGPWAQNPEAPKTKCSLRLWPLGLGNTGFRQRTKDMTWKWHLYSYADSSRSP
jgi:hypothetical protein